MCARQGPALRCPVGRVGFYVYALSRVDPHVPAYAAHSGIAKVAVRPGPLHSLRSRVGLIAPLRGGFLGAVRWGGARCSPFSLQLKSHARRWAEGQARSVTGLWPGCVTSNR